MASSFFGVGAKPPSPESGAMLAAGAFARHHTPLSPGLAITVLVPAFSVLDEGLRGALDPKGA